MKKLWLPFIVLILFSQKGWSQDPQFSQFYANPLYLNPAMAGGALQSRATLNYRNQWPSLAANFVTTTFGFDTYLPNLNSGLGFLVTTDAQGAGNIKSTELGLQYAYQVQLNESNFLRMGLQGTMATRKLDYFGLTFGDQFSPDGYLQSPSTGDPVAQGSPSIFYADFSSGLMAYSDWYWAGVSVHHMNRPDQAFTGLEIARLPMKASVHAGLRIPFAGYTFLGNELDKEKTISPAIMYKKQGKYDQLDLGMYVTYSPLTFGVWYRGLPIKKYNVNINNHEALILLVGYRQDNFSIGYSYDATISTLGFSSGGAHEISLSYLFENFPPRKKPIRRKMKELSCPKF
jgi:type IX secretion system PorP/SprF family membrane protein